MTEMKIRAKYFPAAIVENVVQLMFINIWLECWSQ